MLAYRRVDVRHLNVRAREVRRAAGADGAWGGGAIPIAQLLGTGSMTGFTGLPRAPMIVEMHVVAIKV
jgi:hypothetical protein